MKRTIVPDVTVIDPGYSRFPDMGSWHEHYTWAGGTVEDYTAPGFGPNPTARIHHHVVDEPADAAYLQFDDYGERLYLESVPGVEHGIWFAEFHYADPPSSLRGRLDAATAHLRYRATDPVQLILQVFTAGDPIEGVPWLLEQLTFIGGRSVWDLPAVGDWTDVEVDLTVNPNGDLAVERLLADPRVFIELGGGTWNPETEELQTGQWGVSYLAVDLTTKIDGPLPPLRQRQRDDLRARQRDSRQRTLRQRTYR